MSAAPDVLATRLRISDPKPTRCAACFRGADETVRFVDFDAAIDRGAFVDPNSMALLESIDDLHLCEDCVRQATEVIAFKPELHARQRNRIRSAEREVEHWREYAKRLEATLEERPERAPNEPERGRVLPSPA